MTRSTLTMFPSTVYPSACCRRPQYYHPGTLGTPYGHRDASYSAVRDERPDGDVHVTEKDELSIYFNPRCSKCRTAQGLLARAWH